MTDEKNWPETFTVLGFLLAVLIAVKSWMSGYFKEKRLAREAQEARQERERSETITKAVQAGLESFNKEIRQEFKDYKHTTDKQFDNVNKRIDDLFKELKEK
jgi:Tfp pilus assembly protein PilO